MSSPETVICTFRVKADAEALFAELLRKHWPTLRALELVTDTPEQVFRSVEADRPPVIVSVFEWVDAEAAERAHEHPDIADIWEAMDAHCEHRDGRPAMEFPHFAPLRLGR